MGPNGTQAQIWQWAQMGPEPKWTQQALNRTQAQMGLSVNRGLRPKWAQWTRPKPKQGLRIWTLMKHDETRLVMHTRLITFTIVFFPNVVGWVLHKCYPGL